LPARCAGDLASVEDLLAQGEDVNSRGAQNRTPLHRAVGKGHNGVVRLLIQKGADLSLLDQGGLTPLYVLRSHSTSAADP
jgi:ankyrin repeat protein